MTDTTATNREWLIVSSRFISPLLPFFLSLIHFSFFKTSKGFPCDVVSEVLDCNMVVSKLATLVEGYPRAPFQ